MRSAAASSSSSGPDPGRAMAAVDAQMLLLSAKTANDQFGLFAFDGAPDDLDAAVGELRHRARQCADLRLRVADEHPRRYPRWVPGPVASEQFIVHAGTGGDWQSFLDRVSRLPQQQLDASQMCWRVHVFPEVTDVPGASAAASVVVVQIAHALGDGTRSAELAGVLLGRRGPIRTVPGSDPGHFARRAVAAARAHRRLSRDTRTGLLAPPTPPVSALGINSGSSGPPVLRTIAVDRTLLTGHSVTVAALVAVSEALAGYLKARGEDISSLSAEVPIATGIPASPRAHNNFRNVGVALHPESGRVRRAEQIRGQLDDHRRRSEHPAAKASAAAFDAVPAWLLRWGIGRFDPAARSSTVTGHTVVSSINRGPADLSFGGCPVILTAGYPALSPMMALTHGVHGIGTTIAVSVHADATVIDVDDYVGRLHEALVARPRAL
jgi:hypothetical protein